MIFQCILLVVDFNIVERRNLIKGLCLKYLFLFRLKYYGDNIYEIDGFTTSVKAKSEDIELLCTSNTGMMKNLILKKKKIEFIFRWSTIIKSS
jgi:hypothetical protein